VFLLAWGVEHLGVTSGFPFGRYRYTAQLQPQLLGVVPLAIPCAWLMVAVGAWQLADSQPITLSPRHRVTVSSFLAATLVLLLDLQIEPVATAINRYWVWLDGGAYYDVPAANFAAWWAVGLAMAALVGRVLGRPDQRPPTNDHRPTTNDHRSPDNMYRARRFTFYVVRFTFYAIPAGLYLLNTLMFVVINLAWGYLVAGVVGLAILSVCALATLVIAMRRQPVRAQHTG
jgi:putative membrane protein